MSPHRKTIYSKYWLFEIRVTRTQKKKVGRVELSTEDRGAQRCSARQGESTHKLHFEPENSPVRENLKKARTRFGTPCRKAGPRVGNVVHTGKYCFVSKVRGVRLFILFPCEGWCRARACDCSDCTCAYTKYWVWGEFRGCVGDISFHTGTRVHETYFNIFYVGGCHGTSVFSLYSRGVRSILIRVLIII